MTPTWWNKTLTIYNKAEDPTTGGVTWYAHHVAGCFVKRTADRAVVGSVAIESNASVIRVPQQPDYLPPIEWQALPVSLRGQNLTLQVGDIVVVGAVSDTIDEYTPGHRSSDLLAKYTDAGAVRIKAVTVNIDLPGPHYKVIGE